MSRPLVSASAALLALASLGWIGCASVRWPEAPSGPHLSVLTWNVNFGGPRADLAHEILAAEDADIVFLQEANAGWQSALLPRLREHYPHSMLREARGAGGQLLLSKVPVREISWAVAGPGWFPAWIVEASTPIGVVQFASLHLRPPISDDGSWVSGYFTTGDVRRGEVEAVLGWLDPQRPLVILGDFNESAGGALRLLEEAGFVSALAEFDRHRPTWRWPLGPITLRNRLDHVLYNSKLYALSSRVVDAGGSDHFPIVTVLDPARPRPAPDRRYTIGSTSRGGIAY